jgi:hypothetical protein
MSAKEKFVFGRNNIILILIGMGITLVGFVLMIGGGSEDPNVFNKEELFSHVRITFAPLLVIAGYAVVIYGIMKKSTPQA